MSILDRAGPEPDEVVAYGDDPDQVIEHWYAEGPAITLLHGGFWRPEWDRKHLRTMAGALRDAGHRVALPEYRRVPGEPDLTTADIAAALSTIGPSTAIGHSAGGHLALWAASEAGARAGARAGSRAGSRAAYRAAYRAASEAGARAGSGLRHVIALAPVADLVLAEQLDLDGGAVRDFVGGPASSRPDLDPNRSALAGVPVVVLHGTEDDRVPLAVSESYAAGHDVRLVTLPGVDHFAPIDPASDVWPVLLDEVTR